MKKVLHGLAVLGFGLAVALSAQAAEEGETPHYPLKKPTEENWSFAGPFGTYDKGQLQRG
ncbi:MAG TPA: cytochrome c1, partial [Rhizobiaceae bacterium]|nr:cytochrome c1 [Rhizobiaceae bacterium]